MSTDEAAVQAAATPCISYYTKAPFYAHLFASAGFPIAADGTGVDTLVKALVVAGDRAQVEKRLCELLKSGLDELLLSEPALGAWLSHPSVPSARIMARLGFDWLVVDMEHSAHNPVLMAAMVATIADAGTSGPMVRIPGNSVEWYKWALDAGAWGIIVPMVNTREEAQRAVEYAKYPPLGTRSIGGAFGPYGFGITNWLDYARMANEEIIVTVQVESSQALENLDDILSVPGIDVAFVGPNDLHAQLGLTPSTEGVEPEFVDALERIKAAAQKHHVTLGIFSGGGEAAAERVRQGFQMVSVTTDISSMIADATQQLRLARGRR